MQNGQIIKGDSMFTNYILKDNILYLEIDINYEFGNFSNKNKNIFDELKIFINKLNLKNKFDKIVITCGGIAIGSLIFFSNNKNISSDSMKYVPNINNDVTIIVDNENITETVIVDNEVTVENNTNPVESNADVNYNDTTYQYKENINPQDNYTEPISYETMITIYRSNGEVITIPLEEYIIGVLASEMPASFNSEALKAGAVAARTYALKAKDTGKTLTDTVSTQGYIDQSQMQNKWGSSFDYYYNKIKDAVYSTKGEYLTYNGYYIEALYHSTNNGKTESSLDVFGNYYPYLVSVTSEFDKNASSYLRETTMDINNVSSRLGINLNNDSVIEILSYTDGNNIKEISIDGKIFTGKNIRELLALRSADFDINIDNNIVNITTRGYGHGVGLSQYGANGMANAGYSYRDILYHYYPGTYISN